eukprot:COSAG03_NODE_86_length_13617_cov_15.756843_7_plen_123_part_00
MHFDEVVRGGSPQMHAADFATAIYPPSASTHRGTSKSTGSKQGRAMGPRKATIDSLDAPLLSAVGDGRPPSVLLNRQMEPMRHVYGVHFNLWNNAWSTNYPFFYPFIEEDKNIVYEFEVVWD